jgi:hypothetical protein
MVPGMQNSSGAKLRPSIAIFMVWAFHIVVMLTSRLNDDQSNRWLILSASPGIWTARRPEYSAKNASGVMGAIRSRKVMLV